MEVAGFALRTAALIQGAVGLLALAALRFPFVGLRRAWRAFAQHRPSQGAESVPPEAIGAYVTGMSFAMALLSIAFAVLCFALGLQLWRARNYRLTRWLLIVQCLAVPVGTIVGLFTSSLLDWRPARERFHDG